MPTSDPTAALTLLVQFCIEYANSLKDRPATREAVLVQMRDAARILNEAITPKEVAPNAGTTN